MAERTAARSTSLSAAGEGSRDEFSEYILLLPVVYILLAASTYTLPLTNTVELTAQQQQRRRH
jgi:hypothetical protein